MSYLPLFLHCFFVSLILNVVVAGEDTSNIDNTDMKLVRSLNHHNFPKETSAPGSKWFVMFFTPWCPHCRGVKPLFAALSVSEAVQFEGSTQGLSLGTVDCTQWKALCSANNVNMFPTMRYGNFGNWYDYVGAHSYVDLATFAHRFANPSLYVKEVRAEDFGLFSTPGDSGAIRVALVLPDKKEKDKIEIFRESFIAAASFIKMDFGFVKSTKILRQFDQISDGNDDEPIAVLYNDVIREVFGGPWDIYSISHWLTPRRFLVVENIDRFNFYDLSILGKRMALILVDAENKKAIDEPTKKMATVLRQAAGSRGNDSYLLSNFVFGVMDASSWEDWLKTFGITRESLPQFLVFDSPNDLYFKNESVSSSVKIVADDIYSKANAATSIEKMLLDVLQGTETEYVKSYSGYFNKLVRWFWSASIQAKGLIVICCLLALFLPPVLLCCYLPDGTPVNEPLVSPENTSPLLDAEVISKKEATSSRRRTPGTLK